VERVKRGGRDRICGEAAKEDRAAEAWSLVGFDGERDKERVGGGRSSRAATRREAEQSGRGTGRDCPAGEELEVEDDIHVSPMLSDKRERRRKRAKGIRDISHSSLTRVLTGQHRWRATRTKVVNMYVFHNNVGAQIFAPLKY
jgi:hypothetical protein